jgi:transcriptional regulator with XRE-family HTH domain
MAKTKRTALQRHIFEHGLTLEKIAHSAGLSPKTVWWAANNIRASERTIQELSKATGSPTKELTTTTNNS